MTRRAAVITMVAACTLAVAGPAAVAAAAPSARATGTPGSAVSRLLAPGARWLRSGARGAAGERAMIAQATAAASTGAELYAVSCTGQAQCTATGLSDATLAELWNGSTWTAETTVNPATFSELSSVSCTSATHCVAVGADSASATGAIHPLVEVWNGSTWTQQTAPN